MLKLCTHRMPMGLQCIYVTNGIDLIVICSQKVVLSRNCPQIIRQFSLSIIRFGVDKVLINKTKQSVSIRKFGSHKIKNIRKLCMNLNAFVPFSPNIVTAPSGAIEYPKYQYNCYP